MSDFTAKQVAEMAEQFAKSDFGDRFLTAMSLQYNGLHQEAENESLSVEQKALKVERAAGIKWCIDFVTSRQTLLRTKAYEEPAMEQ